MLLTFVAVVAGAFLAGIAVAAALPDQPVGALLAAQQVGPSGGTIRFEGGEIRVPSGALSQTTRIVVRRTRVEDRVRVRPPGARALEFRPGELVAYVFEPSDVEFFRPITLIFRLQGRVGGAAVFARSNGSTVAISGRVDADRGTVSLDVADFKFLHGQTIGRRS